MNRYSQCWLMRRHVGRLGRAAVASGRRSSRLDRARMRQRAGAGSAALRRAGDAWPDFCGTDLSSIPNARERFDSDNAIVREKLDTALLPAMRNHGIDMWIVLDRENNYEPLHGELGGGFSGVRGAFIFFDSGGDEAGEDLLQLARAAGQLGDRADLRREAVLRLQKEGPDADYCARPCASAKPKKIGVNTSATLPEADGLTVGLQDFLVVDDRSGVCAPRIVSAELLVRDYRTNRTPLETKAVYRSAQLDGALDVRGAQRRARHAGQDHGRRHRLVARGSRARRRAHGLGHASRRSRGELLPLNAPMPIEPGDIISIDGGLQYLSFATDIKRAVYVLKPGETAPPASIVKAWEDTLQFADLYASRMMPGQVGHKVWEGLMQEVEKQGLCDCVSGRGRPRGDRLEAEIGVYGHSVGNVAHDIGARIAQDLPFAYGDRVRFPLWRRSGCRSSSTSARPFRNGAARRGTPASKKRRRSPTRALWMIPRQSRLLLIASDSKPATP